MRRPFSFPGAHPPGAAKRRDGCGRCLQATVLTSRGPNGLEHAPARSGIRLSRYFPIRSRFKINLATEEVRSLIISSAMGL